MTTDEHGLADEWALILDGDDAAWRALVNRHQRLVYGLALKSGLDAAEAADCFQSVWLGLFRNRERIEDYRAVSGWLAKATVRSAARIRTRRRRESFWTSDDRLEDLVLQQRDEAMPADEAIDRERLADHIRSAITKSGTRCRLLLRRLFLSVPPATYEELAEELKMPTSSIGPTRSRCLTKLRKLLDDDGFFREAGISDDLGGTDSMSERSSK